jgi:hypothetical protein
MAAKVSLALKGICEILIVDADGQHLALESFKNLDAARQLPAASCPISRHESTLWNRNTRAMLAASRNRR